MTTDTANRARLASLGLPHSSDWLLVVPCPSLGLHIKGTEFRVAALYRLGMPVFLSGGACVACGLQSDSHGNHAISCGSHGERSARHNHLRDAVYATAASAHLAPTREDRAFSPGTDGRPADVLIPNLLCGLHAALDITVLKTTLGEPGYALRARHQYKWSKYGDKCLAEGIKCCPLVVETIGGWHEEAIAILRQLCQALARATGGEEGEISRHMFGRLSVLLQRDSATLLLKRIPQFIVIQSARPKPDMIQVDSTFEY